MALFALRAGAARWPTVDLLIINVVQGYFLIKCLGGNAVRLFGGENRAAAAGASLLGILRAQSGPKGIPDRSFRGRFAPVLQAWFAHHDQILWQSQPRDNINDLEIP
jgi:hypothetical protein